MITTQMGISWEHLQIKTKKEKKKKYEYVFFSKNRHTLVSFAKKMLQSKEFTTADVSTITVNMNYVCLLFCQSNSKDSEFKRKYRNESIYYDHCKLSEGE